MVLVIKVLVFYDYIFTIILTETNKVRSNESAADKLAINEK